jgi:hypothetical protein
MLQSFLKQKPQKAGVMRPIPAPTLGWNSSDSIADMDARYALLLDNFFPTSSDVMLRKGWEEWVGQLGDQVESLLPYMSDSGTPKLFAAVGTSFYDVTTTGTSAGAAVVTGLTNSRWQSTNFTNSGATSYLTAFNGTDDPRYYDGSSWTAITAISSPAILGVTPTTLNCPWQHQRRLWAVQESTLKAWYFPVDAVGGTANALDLSGFASKGGYLVAGGTWTLDAGEGVDDYWVAVTSEGQVIVYRGTDPSSANTWSMVGKWDLGKPIGRRCFAKYGGDLLYIAEDGVWPLSKALISDRVDPRVALTDKITTAMNDAATAYGSNFGWDLNFFPKAPFVLMNVPVQEGASQQQYVMNTISKAWCRFKDIDANCWAVLDGDLYFGADGFVGKAWHEFSDENDNINGDAKQAFNDLGFPGRTKQLTASRPIFASNGTPAFQMAWNIDYDDNELSGSLSFSPTTYATWDVTDWDDGFWGGGLSVLRNWQSAIGVGVVVAPRLTVASKGIETRWQSTQVIFKPGSML